VLSGISDYVEAIITRKQQATSSLFFFAVLLCTLWYCAGCSPHTEGDPIQQGLPTKYGIIIVDMQEDFILPKEKLPVDRNQARKTVRSINSLLAAVHTNGVEVLYVGNEFSPEDSIGNWFRNHAAIVGQKGTKLVADLTVVNDTYFTKDKPDAFSNSAFDAYLRDKKVNHLILTGVFADQCVMSTAKGGLQRRYTVAVIPEAVAAKNSKNHEEAIKKFRKLGVDILATGDTIKQLNRK
jgi:nicotinamidase-related amidase